MKMRLPALALACAASVSCTKPEPDRLRPSGEDARISDASAAEAGTPSPSATDGGAREAGRTMPAYVERALRSPRIVLIGDSIVHYSDELVSRRLAEVIRSSGHPGAVVKGVTRGGQRVDGWIGKQFERYVKDPSFNTVVLEGGVNDIGWYGKVGGARIRRDAFARMLSMLNEMVEEARERHKVLVLVTVSPWKGQITWDEAGQEYTSALNSWMKAEASLSGVFVTDTYSVLGSPCDSEALARGYRGVDVQHPNNEGRKLIGELVAGSMGYPVGPLTQPLPSRPCKAE